MKGLQQDLNAETAKPSALDSLATVVGMKDGRSQKEEGSVVHGPDSENGKGWQELNKGKWVGKQIPPLELLGFGMSVQQEDIDGSPISGWHGCCCRSLIQGRGRGSERRVFFFLNLRHTHTVDFNTEQLITQQHFCQQKTKPSCLVAREADFIQPRQHAGKAIGRRAVGAKEGTGSLSPGRR